MDVGINKKLLIKLHVNAKSAHNKNNNSSFGQLDDSDLSPCNNHDKSGA